MEPTADPDVYAATIPGDFIISKWDLMYFIEALDTAGNGTQWPDLAHAMPYLIVPLER
jgi:hypothetical protein